MPVKLSGIRKSLKVLKFIEMPGGRRVGDRIAYVTRPEALALEAGPLDRWQEDRSFDERAAMRDGSGLTQLLDLARRHGVALCIKG
jgi:hypothetical protein